MQPCPGLNLIQQLRLDPAVLQCGPEIPSTLLDAFTAFQNGHILRPAQFQGQRQKFWVVGVGPVELPHPAQVSGGEAPAPRVVCLEILSGHHRRALLRAGTNDPADLKVQLHLREFRRHELIQRTVHGAVICGFPGIHVHLLSGAPRLILSDRKREHSVSSAVLPFAVNYMSVWKMPLSRATTSSSGISAPSAKTKSRSSSRSFFSRPVAVR